MNKLTFRIESFDWKEIAAFESTSHKIARIACYVKYTKKEWRKYLLFGPKVLVIKYTK